MCLTNVTCVSCVVSGLCCEQYWSPSTDDRIIASSVCLSCNTFLANNRQRLVVAAAYVSDVAGVPNTNSSTEVGFEVFFSEYWLAAVMIRLSGSYWRHWWWSDKKWHWTTSGWSASFTKSLTVIVNRKSSGSQPMEPNSARVFSGSEPSLSNFRFHRFAFCLPHFPTLRNATGTLCDVKLVYTVSMSVVAAKHCF